MENKNKIEIAWGFKVKNTKAATIMLKCLI